MSDIVPLSAEDTAVSPILSRRLVLGGAGALGLALSAGPWSGAASELEGGTALSAGGGAGVSSYPPALTGLRGSDPGSYQVAHALRDGARWEDPEDIAEKYDLIIVGAGLSGLAAAYWFRKWHGPTSRILLLDNHDDFGGHARRNEFHAGKRMLLSFGGTMSIEMLDNYSAESMGLLEELGVDISKFERYFDQGFNDRNRLDTAVFFDKETFGRDQLVVGDPGGPFGGGNAPPEAWRAYLANTPLSRQARADIVRFRTQPVEYLPGLDADEKRNKLGKMSFEAFLVDVVKMDEGAVAYYRKYSHLVRGVGADAIDAVLGLWLTAPEVAASMGMASPYTDDSIIHHFPDGNASIARLLVRSLVPGVAPGGTMEDVVTARFDYAALDRPYNPVRLRLNSTVVHVRNVGVASLAREVEVTYVRAGRAYRVRGAACVLACWNMVIPYVCPDLPAEQKAGLAYNVKAPLVYAKAQIRNWRSLKSLGVGTLYCPGSYFSQVALDFPVSMGDYHCASEPADPCVLHLVRTPCSPGLSIKDQYRVGRQEILETPLETFQKEIGDQLDRILGAGGFKASRDIQAITVNRWPHGYSYMYSPLWDPTWPQGQEPHVVGRQPFGRIAIANADSGALAESSTALNQAHRAVREVMAMLGKA